MINKFDDFNEKYLDSNFGPLYHFTDLWVLKIIMESNSLNIGYYDNPIRNKEIKIISLTRNKDLNLDMRDDQFVRLRIDKNKLMQKYEIIPYDYFINSNKEIYPKSNLKRKSKYESEEVILKPIINLHIYLLSIDFVSNDIFRTLYKMKKELIDYVNKYNIMTRLYENEFNPKNL